MAKITVEILSAAECEQRSSGTDPFTRGWWYHGTTYRAAKSILDGKRKISGEFWLTKNPQGASQSHGTTVLRCTVRLNKSEPSQPGDDRYNRKDGNAGLDQPHPWIGIIEGRVFIDRDSLQGVDSEDADATIPDVADELIRLGNSSAQ